MLIALTLTHFSSELLLKEQMIIPAKKTFTNAGHIHAKLIDFSEICQKKIQRNRLIFTDCFLVKFPPRNFPWNRPIFLRICSWKSFENWLFSAKIPRNRPIVPLILTFFPRKSRKIGRFFHEFWLFLCENPAKSADFSANLPLEIPWNLAFLSAKYQKPCSVDQSNLKSFPKQVARIAMIFCNNHFWPCMFTKTNYQILSSPG